MFTNKSAVNCNVVVVHNGLKYNALLIRHSILTLIPLIFKFE